MYGDPELERCPLNCRRECVYGGNMCTEVGVAIVRCAYVVFFFRALHIDVHTASCKLVAGCAGAHLVI